MLITSFDNPKLKEARKLAQSTSFRKEASFYLLEHKKLIQELLTLKNTPVKTLFVRQDEVFESSTVPVYEVSPHLFKELTSLETPPGVIALVEKPTWDVFSVLESSKRILILDRIQDPSNVGAILRSALAFRVDAVCVSQSADLFHPRTLRAFSANPHKLPVFEVTESVLSFLKTTFQFAYLDPHDGILLAAYHSPEKLALILGSEGQGLSDFFGQALKPESLKIPMDSGIESLNVAVSTGVVLYSLWMR